MAKGSYKCRCYINPVTGRSEQLNEHVFIWLFKEGLWQKGIVNTPEGYNVHHVDFDSSNNDPANLVLVTTKEHAEIHARARKSRRDVRDARASIAGKSSWSKKTPEERAAHMKKAQDAARERLKREGPSEAQKASQARAVAARWKKYEERKATSKNEDKPI